MINQAYNPVMGLVKNFPPKADPLCIWCQGTGIYTDYQDFGDTMIPAGSYDCECVEVVK